MFGDLANLLERATEVCDVSVIKDHLQEEVRSGQQNVLRIRDIKATREFVSAIKPASCTRSTSKPAAQRQDEHEIGATDDDDEAMADEYFPRGGLEHILVAINSQKLSDAAREHEATADSIVAVTHNETTITPGESNSHEEAPATPSPMPNPTTNKRDRSISATSVNPPNKRVCNQAASYLQPLRAAAPTPFMMADQHNYDDRPPGIKATDVFHHHLEMHVQDLRKQHEQLIGVLELQQHHINHELEIHQPCLEAYRAAQEYSLQAEAKVESLRKDNETLSDCLKNLADSQKLCMPSSAENFEAVQQHVLAQLAAKASALQEAEAELGAAHLACHQTEEAARPALEFMNSETPQLEEKKAAADRLGTTVKYTEFLQILVRTSPSAIATLDKVLHEKGLSLEELRAVIEQHDQLAQVDGQQTDVPMA
ncbi:uncharacterized protein FFUJ_10523 [Fusarium fujikuroi IMI 58289]|uniref:Uncharacterized protein n=1 Tax=Gibberella fujikuroi (strain CBS 195.34 / IMI 58289 / NRRL A-6831) TaxID=1279085 RepID=S0ENY3_GIBF5|nr:uncharacterized protein FFUJ_10523 [Fusarium fujikuroi IMI 58289]KLP05554.1 uncharacterized protein LW94_3382 [Fusarium fujikuroi]CCT74468.1 uncharacterized protein FFUJ_10523 [Fusarium fujikuroi IMI 58289]SCO05924.1 uncharacterized protein FFM5_08741 [Fusarium fujikuroi]SCO58213.1 uncharacterized protein FFMR_15369 [Fusarium fujikuroi]